jgi:hypothetical protein
MFARGVVYLHAAHLPVPKSLAAKSSVSVSSKLIEIKGLQILHFGHLRKTGGRGSYRLVHISPLPGRKPSSVKSNHSGHPTKDVHPEPAEGLFSYSSIPVGQHRATSFTSSTSFSSFHSPLSLSSHSTPRLLRPTFPERNLLVSPLFQGARPAGMSPLYRCPDAHD